MYVGCLTMASAFISFTLETLRSCPRSTTLTPKITTCISFQHCSFTWASRHLKNFFM
ncbi:hypothetical protein RchiOBHm_Chr4g0421031 [Rosa chinensis]|uniref:Uncharacterized protein n=1 Tax=Rosa chinensis TaxID=74649 RepID=A0A2P6QY24_ROSCH|nr:hypothetical protein RchiOBHm_Chr4g0421031 [Rosa chinensis]